MMTPDKKYWKLALSKQMERFPVLKKRFLDEVGSLSEPLPLARMFERGLYDRWKYLGKDLKGNVMGLYDTQYGNEYRNLVLMTMAYIPESEIDTTHSLLFDIISDERASPNTPTSELIVKIDLLPSLSVRLGKELAEKRKGIGNKVGSMVVENEIIKANATQVMSAMMTYSKAYQVKLESTRWVGMIKLAVAHAGMKMLSLITDGYCDLEGRAIGDIISQDSERASLFRSTITALSGTRCVKKDMALWVIENLPFAGKACDEIWEMILGNINTSNGGMAIEFDGKIVLKALNDMHKVSFETGNELSRKGLKAALSMSGNAWKKAILSLPEDQQYLLPALLREFQKSSKKSFMGYFNEAPEWQRPYLLEKISEAM